MGELLENYGLQTGSVMLLEPRALRPFKTSEEYLYAMKEDLAEWLNGLYSLNITVDCFMDKLETGVALCEHANKVRKAAQDYKARHPNKKKLFTLYDVPDEHVPWRQDAKPGTFFARDNVHNFISWCRKLGIIDCLLFETEDLVARKNEKSVVLCLLEVARRGARFGMAAPLLVQFEREIDRDIAKDQRQEIKIQDSGDVFAACDVDGCASDTQPAGREPVVKQMSVQMETVNGGIASMVSTVSTVSTTAMTSASVVGVIDDDDDDSSIADSCGSCPQIVTNDLKSLDEMVRELVERCLCPVQFPMIRVAEGKYRIGDTKVMIYVRILRSHVMVRVGGGWDTLEHYLDKHDPCRCRLGHRGTMSSKVFMKQSLKDGSLNPSLVSYERSESPGFVRKPSAQQANNNSSSNSNKPQTPTPAPGATLLSTPPTHRRSVSPRRNQYDPATADALKGATARISRSSAAQSPSRSRDSSLTRTPPTSSPGVSRAFTRPEKPGIFSHQSDENQNEKNSSRKSSLTDSNQGIFSVPAIVTDTQDSDTTDSGLDVPKNRPESRMTQASSECSSTVSTDDLPSPDVTTDATALHPLSKSDNKVRSASVSSIGKSGNKKSRIPVLTADAFTPKSLRSVSTASPLSAVRTNYALMNSSSASNVLNGGNNKEHMMSKGGKSSRAANARGRRSSVDNSVFETRGTESFGRASGRKLLAEMDPEFRTRSTSVSSNRSRTSAGARSPAVQRKFTQAKQPVSPLAATVPQPKDKSSLKQMLDDISVDNDEAILAQMKAILQQYEARITQKLAEEGRDLAKELGDLNHGPETNNSGSSRDILGNSTEEPEDAQMALPDTMLENNKGSESYTEKWLLENHIHPGTRKSSMCQIPVNAFLGESSDETFP